MLFKAPCAIITVREPYLCMYVLLHLRINIYNPSVEIRMIFHHDIRIPGHSDKNGVDAAAERCHEYLADLQPDQEAECHYDWRECAALVVRRVRKLEVEECEEGTEVCDEGRSHR